MPVSLIFARHRLTVVAIAWVGSFLIARAIPDGASGGLFYFDMLAELFRFFGAGMIAYLLSHRILTNARLAWISLLTTTLATLTPFFMEVAAIFGSYCLISFAYLSPPAFRRVTSKGDISYGVYVYAFPIQQLLVPVTIGASIGGLAIPWTANLLLSLPLAILAGTLSWLLVERPSLHRRKAQIEEQRA